MHLVASGTGRGGTTGTTSRWGVHKVANGTGRGGTTGTMRW